MTLNLYIACLHAVFVQRRRDEEQGMRMRNKVRGKVGKGVVGNKMQKSCPPLPPPHALPLSSPLLSSLPPPMHNYFLNGDPGERQFKQSKKVR